MKFTPAIAAAILLYCNLTSVSAAPVTTPPTSGDVQGLSYIIAGPGPYIPAPDSIRSHNETSLLRTNQLASGHVATSEGERRVFHTETETLADGHRGSGDNLHVLSGEGRAHHSDKRFLLPPNHYNPHPGSHPFQPIRYVATAHHAGNNTVPVSLPGPTPSPTGPTTEPHNSTTPLLPRDPRRHPPFPVHRNPTRGSHNGIDAGTVAPILPRGIHLPPFSSNATRASHSNTFTLPIFPHNTKTEAHNGTTLLLPRDPRNVRFPSGTRIHSDNDTVAPILPETHTSSASRRALA
ncbi:hypothetical protein B0J14DRAFT_661433 [Halenospora varia]|nr:hypothetical protein B0J14DRAFT_661433 [Halenospora varia]